MKTMSISMLSQALGNETSHKHTYSDVTYTWSDDNGTCTASVYCAEYAAGTCDESDGYYVTETVDVTTNVTTEATKTTDGAATLTAAFTNSLFATQTKEIVLPATHPYARVTGCSLGLDGYIRLNYYLTLPDAFLSDADAYITLNGNVAALPASAESDGSYKLTCSLAAKEMRDDVTLRLYSGDGEAYPLLSLAGKDVTDSGFTFSVQDYFNAAHSQYGDNASLMALIDRMSDYGNLAQLYFGYNDTGAAVSADTQAAMDQVTADTLAGYAASYTNADGDGIEYIGSSLTLRSGTMIRHYFKITGDIDDYTFYIGGSKVEPGKANGAGSYYYIELDNIAAKELDTAHSVTVKNGGDDVITITNYSALSYVYSVLKSGEADESLVNLVKGLYLYNQAANAYFGA